VPSSRRLIATASIVVAIVLGGVGTAAMAPATTGSPGLPSATSAKSVSATAWTHTVCQSISGWEAKLQSLGTSLSSQLRGQRSAAGLRKLLTQFLQKVVDATNKLVQQFNSAGTPNVNQGKNVAQFFHDGFTQLKDAFAKSLKDAKSLPNNLQAFATRANAIGTQIDVSAQRIQGAFTDAETRFHVPELDTAFRSDPACVSIH
jgi:uncharacterized phage infection (PIP) family protein YhgE